MKINKVKLEKYVNLKQGLAINKQTNYLISDIKNEEFIYPLLRIADMSEKKFTKYVSKNVKSSVLAMEEDIIYTRTGQIGLAFKGFKGVVHNNSFIVNLINETEINKDYLFCILKSNFIKNQVINMAKNSVQPDLTHDMFKSLVIPLPNKAIQEKIAKLYERLSLKIELNNKINSELEAMAKTIYDYWFLQFEFPNEEGKPYKSSGGKMVWNEELKREIPIIWKTGLLTHFIKDIKNGDWGKEIKEGNYNLKVNCIRGTDLSSIHSYKNSKLPLRYILQKNKNKILEDGDMIIEISGGSPTQSTGRICYINLNILEKFDNPLIASNFCKCISLKNKKDIYWFYNFWKKLYDNGVFFSYEGKTTGIKNLLFDSFYNNYKIVIPDEEILEKYYISVKNLFEKIQKNSIENQELTSLRDFLLPLLMNGQVGFKEE
ncbi:MAG: restriction endonuclease subunit S [Fusobacterium mortiferum]|nr:restriction endonuclease subunit S [Fusobacterium mortiferum]